MMQQAVMHSRIQHFAYSTIRVLNSLFIGNRAKDGNRAKGFSLGIKTGSPT